MKYFNGYDQVKKTPLQALRRQYELLQMKKDEKIEDYLSTITTITNLMKLCGETLTEKVIMKKILRILPSQFDCLVIKIKEAKELSDMKIDDLQGIESHERRLLEEEMKDKKNKLKPNYYKTLKPLKMEGIVILKF